MIDIKQKLIYQKEAIATVCLILYKCLLDLMYCLCLCNMDASCHFSPNSLLAVSSWIFFLLMLPSYQKISKQFTVSSLFIIVLYYLYFIPITTYCSYGTGNASFLLLSMVFWLLLVHLQMHLPLIRVKIPQKITVDNNKAFILLIVLCSVISLFFWIYFTKCRIIINLKSVYEFRAEASKYIMPGICKYIRTINNVVAPVVLLISLYKKNKLASIWMVFILYINFCFAGEKILLAIPFLVLACFFLYDDKRLDLIPPIAVLLEILAIIEYYLGKKYLISFIFSRLCLKMPLLADWYYRFFLAHPNDVFRQGFMGRLGLESPYSRSISRVVGDNYLTQVVSCNHGLLADAFIGIGIIGVLLMPIILILIFKVFDIVTVGIEQKYVFGLALYYILCFINSQWSTVLLTRGLIFVLLIMVAFPKEKFREGKI